MKHVAEILKAGITTIPNFPKPGIQFKDLQSVLGDPRLLDVVHGGLIQACHISGNFDALIGLESRGFMFATSLAIALDKPFFMVRKPGKLPPPVSSISYNKEYGQDTLEIRQSCITPGMRVIIHDDLLATGGTADAAAQLVHQCGGIVAGFVFIMELSELKGRQVLEKFDVPIISLVTY